MHMNEIEIEIDFDFESKFRTEREIEDGKLFYDFTFLRHSLMTTFGIFQQL